MCGMCTSAVAGPARSRPACPSCALAATPGFHSGRAASGYTSIGRAFSGHPRSSSGRWCCTTLLTGRRPGSSELRHARTDGRLPSSCTALLDKARLRDLPCVLWWPRALHTERHRRAIARWSQPLDHAQRQGINVSGGDVRRHHLFIQPRPAPQQRPAGREGKGFAGGNTRP